MSRSGVPKPSGSGLSTPLNRSRESVCSSVSGIAKRAEVWKVGDRVTAGEGKVGKIAFKGKTKFAVGDWIGVALDQPIGKNDGSVGGVRYFTCAPNHGLFCKAAKLSKEVPVAEGSFRVPDPVESHSTKPGSSKLGAASESLAHNLDFSMADSMAGGDSILMSETPVKGPPPSTFSLTSTPIGSTLPPELGDRVVVSGTKIGYLRYVGETEFASGTWAGVELDQPIGKNDGSVQGKRYFACKPQYGLFAPLGKVVRATNQSGAGKLIVRHTKTSALRQRSGSQESLSSLNSSIYSSVSTTRPQRVRLGASALNTPESSPHLTRARLPASIAQRGVMKSSSTAGGETAVLQDALKEKEQHIEQLLKERDMERSEMTRASQQAEEAEQALADERAQFARTQTDWELKIETLQRTLRELEAEKKELSFSLEEEKKKSEDLTFQIEEESIQRTELESKVISLSSQAPVPAPLDPKEDEAQSLKKEIAALRSDMARKEAGHSSEMGKAQAEILSLQNSIQTHKTESEKLRTDLEQSEQGKTKLLAEFSTEKSNLQSTIQDSAEKEKVIAELKQEISNQKLEFEKLKGSLTQDREASVLAIQSELAAKEAAFAAEKETWKTSTKEQNASLKSQEAELMKVLSELDTVRTEKVNLEKLLETEKSSAELKASSDSEKAAEIVRLKEELETERINAQTQKNEILQWAVKYEATEKKEEEEKMERLKELELTREKLKTSMEEKAALEEKISNLQTEFRGIQEAQNLAAEILAKTVMEEKAKLEEEIGNQKNIIGQLTKECETLQANSASTDQAKGKIESEVASLKQELATAKEEKEKLIAAAEAEKLQIIDQLQVAQRQKLEKEATLKEQKAADVLKTSRIETLNSELERLKADIAAQEKVLAKSHDEAVNQLSAETAKIREELAGYKEMEQNCFLEKQNAEKLLEEERTAQRELQKAKEEIEKDLGQTKSELIAANTNLEKLGQDSKKLKQEVEEGLLREKDNLDASKKVEVELKGCQDELEKSTKEFETTAKELANLKESLEQQNSSQGELLAVKAKLETELQTTQAELNLAKAECEQSKESFKEGKEQQAKEYDIQITQLKSHLEESAREKEALNLQQKGLLDDVNSKFSAEIESLKKSLHDSESAKNTLEQEAESTRTKLETALDDAQKEISRLSAHITDLSSQVEGSTQSSACQKAEWEEEKRKLTELSANQAEECRVLRVSYERTCEEQKEYSQKTTNEILSLKSQLEMTETEKGKLNEEKSTLVASMEAAENEIKVLRDQVIGVESSSDKGQAELREQLKEAATKTQAVIAQLEESGQNLSESKKLNDLMKEESTRLKAELEATRTELSQFKATSLSNEELQIQLRSAQKREEALNLEMDTITARHSAELGAVKLELTEVNQLLRSQRENTGDSSKSSIERLEQEKFELLERITELEGKLAKSNVAPQLEGGSADADFKMQVDFLNSVIVDQKKKIDELQLNIDILKRTSLDDMGLRNGLPKVPAPRLYCDICEEFDLHDTDDCPKQAGEMDDFASHSRSFGSRSEERPYCDNCETFGHLRDDCDNDTF